MRGEHVKYATKDMQTVGSSPHARGALKGRRSQGVRPWDHPRMRGEHHAQGTESANDWGSSPHARGAPGRRLNYLPAGGIIPACAGSTPTTWAWETRSRDHPRMRGEHSYPLSPTALALDHPRMRGEHASISLSTSGCAGSSPHARGALCPSRLRWDGLGIIPACAGSTRDQQRRRAAPRDHPRMRGEHRAHGKRRGKEGGSSPHARGALHLDVPLHLVGGDHPRMRGEHDTV